jgi:hypothetical protein
MNERSAVIVALGPKTLFSALNYVPKIAENMVVWFKYNSELLEAFCPLFVSVSILQSIMQRTIKGT